MVNKYVVRRKNVKNQRAPALQNSTTSRQPGDTPGSKLAYSSRESLLYTQGVRGSSPLPPTIETGRGFETS